MPTYFDFMVTLNRIKPPIWRRFLLHDEATFHELHMAIQQSLGWKNCHLFEFSVSGLGSEQIAGSPFMERGIFGEKVPNASRVRLSTYFDRTTTKCRYQYDFGDSWNHEVKVKGMVEDEETFKRRLIGGARACPPEDCGAVDGYERFEQIVKTGKDPDGEDDVEESLEWLDGWEPEAFDLEKAKKAFDKKGRKATRRPRLWVLGRRLE